MNDSERSESRRSGQVVRAVEVRDPGTVVSHPSSSSPWLAPIGTFDTGGFRTPTAYVGSTYLGQTSPRAVPPKAGLSGSNTRTGLNRVGVKIVLRAGGDRMLKVVGADSNSNDYSLRRARPRCCAMWVAAGSGARQRLSGRGSERWSVASRWRCRAAAPRDCCASS